MNTEIKDAATTTLTRKPWATVAWSAGIGVVLGLLVGLAL